MTKELTKEQIRQQDDVDNTIYDMLLAVSPPPKDKYHSKMKWDIEVIAEIRDVVQKHVTQITGCSEMEFYPYIQDEQLPETLTNSGEMAI